MNCHRYATSSTETFAPTIWSRRSPVLTNCINLIFFFNPKMIIMDSPSQGEPWNLYTTQSCMTRHWVLRSTIFVRYPSSSIDLFPV